VAGILRNKIDKTKQVKKNKTTTKKQGWGCGLLIFS
jgi:hypothetical protein